MRTALAIALTLVAIAMTGCATQTHCVRYTPNTEPSVDTVYPKNGTRINTSTYLQKVTDADRQAGKIEIPVLIFEREGYKPYEISPGYISLDNSFWQHRFESGNRIIHGYQNTKTVHLQPDPNYRGPKNKNKVLITINSEPQGARVYEDGQFIGTTPLKGCYYTLDFQHYDKGSINGKPFTIVHDGFLPKEYHPSISVEHDWRYERGKKYEKSMLVILQRDSNALRQVVVPGGNSGSSHPRGDYAEAKRVYEAALAGYKKAMSEFDNAKNMRSLSNMSFGTLMGGSKLDRAVGLLNQGTTHLSLQDAERNVQIARERLERAKARLDAINWK